MQRVVTRHSLGPALLLAAALGLAVAAWLPRGAPVVVTPAPEPLRPVRLHAVAALPSAPAAPKRVRHARRHPVRHARTAPRHTVAPRPVATVVATAAPAAVPTAAATARPVATAPPAPVATVAAPRSTPAPQFDSSGGFDSSG
jgi:hypothetical protein